MCDGASECNGGTAEAVAVADFAAAAAAVVVVVVVAAAIDGGGEWTLPDAMTPGGGLVVMAITGGPAL